MQLIKEVKTKIIDLRFCRGGELLAQALASACSSLYSINLLDVSVYLDAGNQELVFRLGRITHERDHDSNAHNEAINWLKENQLLHKIEG